MWCAAFAPAYAHAGAWPLPEGSGQVILTTTYDTANRSYDGNWDLTQEINFSKTDTQLFLEYGLTPKITLVLETALQDVDYTSRDGRTRVQGFGNSAVGVRRQIFHKDRSVLAVQGKFILAGTGENIPDADLGRGGNGVELRGLYGRNFKLAGRNGFLDTQAAWIFRSGNAPESYKADITLGLNLTDKIQILGQNFYSRTGDQILGVDRILSNESLKAQISVVRKQSAKRSYQFGLFQTVAGRNIVKEKAVFFGVWRRY